MNDKPFAEQIRDITRSLHDQHNTAMKLFLAEASKILEAVRKSEEDIAAERAAFKLERQAMGRERSNLRDAAVTAERREAQVQHELTEANDEIARLLAQLNIIHDATERGQQGAQIARRLSDNQPAFSPLPELPQGHKGYVYQSVLADAVTNYRNLEEPDPLAALAELAKDHRSIIDTKKLEAEIPVVSVTPEARELASAGT